MCVSALQILWEWGGNRGLALLLPCVTGLLSTHSMRCSSADAVQNYGTIYLQKSDNLTSGNFIF